MRLPRAPEILLNALLLAFLATPAQAFRETREHLREAPGWLTLTPVWLAAVCLNYAHEAAVTAPLVGLSRKLEEMRELEFRYRVPYSIRTPAGVRAMFEADWDRDYPAELVRRDEAVLEHLGLVPQGFQLKPFLIGLLEEQVAGAYDPRRDFFFIVRRERSGWFGRMLEDPEQEGSIILHELQHAMQQQRFGLLEQQRKLSKRGESDAAMAYQALVEGDASVVMFDYLMAPESSIDMPMSLMANLTSSLPFLSGKKFTEAPIYFRRMLITPYLNGADFVNFYRSVGGWEQVDDLYADPPRSTEQIFHPERYMYDMPKHVAMDLPSTLPGGWKADPDDVGGEFLVRVFLEQHGVRNWAALADGWGGDRLRIYRRGDESFLVWLLRWDDPAEGLEAGLRQTGYPVERKGKLLLVTHQVPPELQKTIRRTVSR